MGMERTYMLVLFLFNFFLTASASSLEELSRNANKDLPEVYDHATKLMRTTVENGNFVSHFLVRASQEGYAIAIPKVRSQVMTTVCKHTREKVILGKHSANLLYRYENEKGQSLGEFMIPAGFCGRKNEQ